MPGREETGYLGKVKGMDVIEIFPKILNEIILKIKLI